MPRKEKPKWTIMVYLAGDNNLTSYCISVLQQLEAAMANHNKDVCVLACFDSNTPWPKGSRYLAVNCAHRYIKKVVDWEIHNDLISPTKRGHKLKTNQFCALKQTDQNGARPYSRPVVAEGLKRFINWSVKQHSDSDRYMLVLFGHGPVVAGQTFLARENPPSSLRMEDLQEILGHHFGPSHNRTIDILACQNCVMNGIETAFEVRNHADFMIGSQGLVLATGWPYETMIKAITDDVDAPTEVIARKMMKACARNLLDFSVMDRSSEQSLCDLRKLRNGEGIIKAINGLVNALNAGLVFQHREGQAAVLKYPVVRDAVKLARLEAQSYWQETFVDLYDFCERLLKQCRSVSRLNSNVMKEMKLDPHVTKSFRDTSLGRVLRRIARRCIEVQKEIDYLVRESFYIGSDLQYSHGLSIYFPWTYPTDPYDFIRMPQGRDFWLKTAFETYSGYRFVERSKWAGFLNTFFRATLRNMRRAKQSFTVDPQGTYDLGLTETVYPQDEVLTIDLQKSSPDTGITDREIWSTVKNYPRRNYLSPADCPRKILTARCVKAGTKDFLSSQNPPVSYLGWNVTGLVAEVIEKRSGNGKSCAASNGQQNGGQQKAAAKARST